MNPFNDCLGSVNCAPINNFDIDYYFPYSHESYILLLHNALYLPYTEDKLLLPFIMREKEAAVSATMKIHCTDPTSKEHCIKFSNNEIKMPLHINGTFYFFHTRRPTDDDLQSREKIFINPDRQH